MQRIEGKGPVESQDETGGVEPTSPECRRGAVLAG